MRRAICCLAALLVVAGCPDGHDDCPTKSRLVQVPGKFVVEPIATGFDRPVAIAFARDGRMFVAEKEGRVVVVKDGVKLETPLIDLRDEVRGMVDGGLLGLELHPDFPRTPYVYLLYVVDPDGSRPDDAARGSTWGRLTRFSVTGDVADPASRHVLLGDMPESGPPMCFPSHSIGSVKFALDGTLVVGTGEGAHWDRTDTGENLDTWDPSCEALFGPDEDIGALRAQSLDSLGGKLLRLDAETGLGLPDNPFFDGNPASNRSRVWALGLRNPFRFQIRPGSGPGTIYVGDVGQSSFEELDVARGGENFGWPCFEGSEQELEYVQDPTAAPLCAALTASSVTFPAVSTAHDGNGNAASGVVLYEGTMYPDRFRGALFFTDFVAGWVRAAFLDATDQVTGIEELPYRFETPVDLVSDPATGDLVYVSLSSGTVERVRYSTTNLAPAVMAAAAPESRSAPRRLRFSSDGTFDHEGDAMSLRWDFGDGTGPVFEANPVHEYASSGTHVARLIACDANGNKSTAAVSLTLQDAPPRVRIVSPANGTAIADGTPIPLAAEATDSNGGVPAQWEWRVDLLHDGHPHYDELVSSEVLPPPFVLSGLDGNGTERLLYRVRATVTDAAGQSASDTTYAVRPGFTNAAPVVSLVAAPLEGKAPLVVQFDASETEDADDDRVSFSWDFGDGTTSRLPTVIHVYGSPGTYEAKLVAQDPFVEAAPQVVRVQVTK